MYLLLTAAVEFGGANLHAPLVLVLAMLTLLPSLLVSYEAICLHEMKTARFMHFVINQITAIIVALADLSGFFRSAHKL